MTGSSNAQTPVLLQRITVYSTIQEKEGSLSLSLLKNLQLNTERQRLTEQDSGDYRMESRRTWSS